MLDMPSAVKIPLLEDPTPPPEAPNRGKHAVRALLGFLHFTVAVLLLTAAIIALTRQGNLFVAYIIPFSLLIFIAEARRRMHKKKTALIDERLKVFNLIRVRGIFYQICGAIVILCEPRGRWGYGYNYGDVTALGWTVWTIGLVLLIVGTVARELGFLKWFDDNEDAGMVRLEDSDDEIASLLSSPV